MAAVPKGPMTAEQQLDALKRVQAQAEQRVQLGMQFFKAAESRVADQQAQLDQLKAEQDRLREQVETDVGRTLLAYDQWVGQIDEGFTRALRGLEQRVDDLHAQWTATQARLEEMAQRSQVMLDQSRAMLECAGCSDDMSPQARAAASPLPLNEKLVSKEEIGIYRTLLRRMEEERTVGQFRRHERDAAA